MTTNLNIGSLTSGISVTVPDPPDVPGAPTVTIGSPITAESIPILWSPPESDGGATITNYNVYAAPHGDPLTLVTTVSGGSRAYTFSALLSDTEYDFAVEATNSAGTGDQSAIVSASTLPAGDPPEAPVIALGAVTAATATITWVAPSSPDSAITGYRAYRVLVGDDPELAATLPAVTTFTFTDLAPEADYEFFIVAVNAYGDSPDSNIVEATTGTLVGNPDAPTITDQSVTSTTASIIWSTPIPRDMTVAAITGHKVYIAPHGDTLVLADTLVGASTEYEFTGLDPDTLYDVAVESVSVVGTSPKSATVTVHTTTAPAAPVLIGVGVSTTTSAVRWIPPDLGGAPITSYKLYAALEGDTLVQVATVPGSTSWFTFTGLDPATAYDHAIEAVSDAGTSPRSAILTRTTLAEVDGGEAPFHQFPGAPESPPRYMRAVLWDDERTRIISELPDSRENHIEDPPGDIGGGSFVMHADAPGAVEVVGGRIVQTQVWNEDDEEWKDAYQWRIEDTPKGVVKPNEGQRLIRPAGRGVAQDWEMCLVDPYGGVEAVPWSDVRSFGWQAPEMLDNGTGDEPWTSPNLRSVIALPTALPPYGLAGKPYGFPNPLAPWLWGIAPTGGHDAVGFNYFRYRFTLNAELDVTFYVTADDLFVAALNDVDIIDFQADKGDAAGSTYWRKLHLKPGDYTFAVRVENLDRPGIAENCGLMVACATYQISPTPTQWNTMDTQRFLFTTAGWSAVLGNGDPDERIGHGHVNGWRARAYPAQAPGMTPGSIINYLFIEAKRRGELRGWGHTFTDLLDSSGTPWPEFVREFQCRVGTSYVEVLKQLEEQGYINWAVDPGSLALHMWAQGHDHGASGAVFERGVNVRDLEHSDKWGLRRDKIMARTEDGWVRRGEGSRQSMVSIPDWTEREKINAYLDQQIARSNADATSVTLDFVPTTAAVTPYAAGLRNYRTAQVPGVDLTPYTPRITGIVLDEAAKGVGPPRCRVTFESPRHWAEERQARVQQRTAPGAFDGRAASIAPYAKSQPQGGELRLVEVGFNLTGRAEGAATNAVADGLTYADSADKRPSGRLKLCRARLTCSLPQVDDGPPEGFSVVQLLYNGAVGQVLILGPGEYERNDFFGSNAVDPRFADLYPIPNFYLETGPLDSIKVQLVQAGTHRNLYYTVWGYEVP